MARRCERRNRFGGVFRRACNADLLHRSNRGRAEMSAQKGKAAQLWRLNGLECLWREQDDCTQRKPSMLSLSDLGQALKMTEELSIWAGLPLYGIGYGVAIWIIASGLGKLREVVFSWIKSIKEWRDSRNER